MNSSLSSFSMYMRFKVTLLSVTLSERLGLFFPISELQCDTQFADDAFKVHYSEGTATPLFSFFSFCAFAKAKE